MIFRRLAVRVSAGLLFCGPLIGHAAESGWREFSWGISPSQATAVAKTRIREANPEEDKPRNDGSRVLRIVEGFELVGQPFKAELAFCGDALCRVNLQPDSRLDAHASKAATEGLLAALNQKYGVSRVEGEGNSDLSFQNARWVNGDTSIQMLSSQQLGLLIISYQHVPGTSSNL